MAWHWDGKKELGGYFLAVRSWVYKYCITRRGIRHLAGMVL